MIYVVGWLVYIFLLIICTPAKSSLRNPQKISLLSRLLKNKGSLLMGTVVLLVAALTFDSQFELNRNLGYLLGLSRSGIFEHHWYWQFLTHVFLHGGKLHLLVNLNSFVILSAYERRVGFTRYCAVFLLSSILGAALELFLLSNDTVTMGASGGLCGLLAALAFDGADLPLLKWLFSTLGLGVGIVLMTIYGTQQAQGEGQVDNLAHFIGVLLGALYTRLLPFSVARREIVITPAPEAEQDSSSKDTFIIKQE